MDGNLLAIPLSIKDNLYNLPTIQELANLVGMSLKQYRKHFKKIVGVYPAKYIYDQKMLIVKQCLLNTELTIAEIAESNLTVAYTIFGRLDTRATHRYTFCAIF